MDTFTLFHFYLIFFLLGLGYATVAVLMGQLLGGHDTDSGGDVGGHEAAEHDFGTHDVGGHEAGAEAAGHDAGAHEAADHAEAGHGDASTDHAHGAGGLGVDSMPQISPLSPVTIATFATSFGGAGLILDKAGLPGFLSFPLSVGGGFGIAGAVFYLFYRVFSVTQSTSSVSARHAIGREAEVITPVPERGTGEIAYVLGGRRFNAPARSDDGAPVAKGAVVVIRRKTGGIFYVHESVLKGLKRPAGE